MRLPVGRHHFSGEVYSRGHFQFLSFLSTSLTLVLLLSLFLWVTADTPSEDSRVAAPAIDLGEQSIHFTSQPIQLASQVIEIHF